MLISSKKKFIFCHFSKVAGSSINDSLRKYANVPWNRLYNYLYEYLGQQPALGVYGRHIRPIELKPYLKESKFNTFFKFAFVRNPWDWHVSAYHYNLNDSNAVWHSIIKKKSFEEYLYWVIDNIEKVGAAQYDFLSDGNGNLLVDYVGRFEALHEDFKIICKRINVRENLGKRNSSKRDRDYRKYYTPLHENW